MPDRLRGPFDVGPRRFCAHARVRRYLKPAPSMASAVAEPDRVHSTAPAFVDAIRCLDCFALDRLDGRGWQGGLA